MTIRRRTPRRAASLAVALAFALAGIGSDDVSGLRTAAAQFPPGSEPPQYPAPPAVDASTAESASGAAIFRTVRPAPVPRNAEEARFFRPLYQPPKTQAALEQVVEFEIVDQPMERFFAGLEETTGVPFSLDQIGLEEAAITSDAEITCRSAGMPLHVALGLIVRDLDLAYVAHDEYVQITSRESAELISQTRLYALGDHPLLRDVDTDFLTSTIAWHSVHDSWRGWPPLKIDVLPGAVAVSGYRDKLPRAESILRQYARLLAEYDAAPAADSDGGFSTKPASSIVTVRRAPAAGRDSLGDPPADPFGDSAPDPFATPAGSGR